MNSKSDSSDKHDTPLFVREPENPIVRPGGEDWRLAVTFNPGVVRLNDGRFLMYERAAGRLRPFQCYVGLLESSDGVRFTQVGSDPIITPEMLGSVHGSVQDPRVVQIEERLYMTYAYRPFAWNSYPTGVSVPESTEGTYDGFDGDPARNMTRSGLAVLDDGYRWKHSHWLTPEDLDDRDLILFPEKVNGRFVLLRRPKQWVGPEYDTETPAMWISFSDDLHEWDEPTLLARAEQPWEGGRIGGSTPPIKTDEGWLLLYHGVERVRSIPWVKSPTGPAAEQVCYRVGAMLLDRDDPRRVIARASHPVMEPREYYERFGLYIPNVIFPTGIVEVDDELWVYYGCCDTAISLARVKTKDLIERILNDSA